MSVSFQSYWGKAGAKDVCHRLPYHCLDVGACGLVLLRRLTGLRRRLEALSGLSSQDLETFVRVYLPLHDLGKFATGFQNLRPDLLERLQHRHCDKGYTERHDTLGYLLWRDELQKRLSVTGRRRRRGSANPAVDSWMRAVTGHHGQPPGEAQMILRDAFDQDDFDAAEAFVRAVLALAGQDCLPVPPNETAAIASWWLAGFAVLADWLGSNDQFFPYQETIFPLNDYWNIALAQAEKAVAASGLEETPAAQRFVLADCFPKPPPDLTPTPLQQWAGWMDLASGPHLFILEDVTGAGKTEAALILAWRLLRREGTGGLYFGLPTMATANGMYQRLGSVYRRLFAPGSQPSLVLAHGRADLVAAFRESALPVPTEEADYGDETEPAGARCSAWLADSRKKALLADAGVGTVDQALLAILASRHQSLRLLGLMDKVLIVDEVHACDAYMNQLLGHLLRVHARAGGNAILLSATLPHQQRHKLLEDFAEGAGWDSPDSPAPDAYPLATCLNAQGLREQPLATRPEVARKVKVRLLEDADQAERLLAEAVAAGRCACWIRNTVGDAIDSFQHLRKTHPDWDIDLFHARFSLADRLTIEERVLRRFGKDSRAEDRRGRILVATQVVEQSLDLDFDVLISDLAPIDLLIQRAGRLQRHARDREGNPVDGRDRRGTPELAVLAPPWEDDPGPGWLREALPGTAAVYEDEDGRLWLAMKLLREADGFAMPDDARKLIEGVYGADPFEDIPEGLQGKALEAEMADKCKATIGEDKVLHLESGYRLQGPWLDEDIAPTRLGEPTVTLWLARLEEERLTPFGGGDPDQAKDWMLSSLTVRRSLACAEVRPAGIAEIEWQQFRESLPGKGKWGLLVVLGQENGVWHGRVRNEQGRECPLAYTPVLGLQFVTD